MKSKVWWKLPNHSALFLRRRSVPSARCFGQRRFTAFEERQTAALGGGADLVAGLLVRGAARGRMVGVDAASWRADGGARAQEGLVRPDKDIYVSVAAARRCRSRREIGHRRPPSCPRCATFSGAGDRLILGVVGLAGEVRPSGRSAAAGGDAQMGFTRCVLPEGNSMRWRATSLELGVSEHGGSHELGCSTT